MDLSTPTWALVEIMGHRRRAGLCQEVEVFGSKQLRIDIPVDDVEFVTELYGGNAIFSFRPATEEVARETARYLGDPRPVKPIQFRSIPAPPADDEAEDAEFEEDPLSEEY